MIRPKPHFQGIQSPISELDFFLVVYLAKLVAEQVLQRTLAGVARHDHPLSTSQSAQVTPPVGNLHQTAPCRSTHSPEKKIRIIPYHQVSKCSTDRIAWKRTRNPIFESLALIRDLVAELVWPTAILQPSFGVLRFRAKGELLLCKMKRWLVSTMCSRIGSTTRLFKTPSGLKLLFDAMKKAYIIAIDILFKGQQDSAQH